MKQKKYRKKQFRPTEKAEKLARHTAEQLRDTGTLPFYIACCNRYPESCIKKALSKTMKATLKRKGRREAFLKNLIYEYAKETYNNSRD